MGDAETGVIITGSPTGAATPFGDSLRHLYRWGDQPTLPTNEAEPSMPLKNEPVVTHSLGLRRPATPVLRCRSWLV